MDLFPFWDGGLGFFDFWPKGKKQKRLPKKKKKKKKSPTGDSNRRLATWPHFLWTAFGMFPEWKFGEGTSLRVPPLDDWCKKNVHHVG